MRIRPAALTACLLLTGTALAAVPASASPQTSDTRVIWESVITVEVETGKILHVDTTDPTVRDKPWSTPASPLPTFHSAFIG